MTPTNRCSNDGEISSGRASKSRAVYVTSPGFSIAPPKVDRGYAIRSSLGNGYGWPKKCSVAARIAPVWAAA